MACAADTSTAGVTPATPGWSPKPSPPGPDTQDEPLGWHKRATWPVRQASRRNDNPQYNRARCEHGSYFLDDGCRVLNCRDIREHQDRARSTARGTA